MKKSVDLLLILPLLLALVYVVVASQTGAIPALFASGTPVPIEQGVESATPTVHASVIPNGTSTISRTSTPTLPPSPSFTSTETITQTPTSTGTPTPINTGTSTATGPPASQEIESGIATGNEIIQAIERYSLEQGHYPPALTDLLPAYLPGLPVTSTGQPYFYRSFDAGHPMAAEGYWLAFRVIEQENLICTYMRRLEYWDCNYASP